MSNNTREPDNVEPVAPLALNKETLHSLDIEPADAGQVKGGASYVYYYLPSGSMYSGGSNVALGSIKPPPPPPGGAY